MHGAGNDFVLLPDMDDEIELSPVAVRLLCDRRRGIGGDGVIRVGPPRPGVDADVFMDYRNADGSVAEMCGNGVRTVAKWVADRWRPEDVARSGARFPGPARGSYDVVAVDTRAGVKDVVCERDADGLVRRCTVDMGAPAVGEVGRRLALPDGTEAVVTTVSMGNPHAVLVVDDVQTAPVTTLGPVIEQHPAFPEGTNVEFIHVDDAGVVHGRIWERGVGETLASGTGGSAMAVAAIAAGLAAREVDVALPGGVLTIRWGEDTLHVTGPAAEVGSGLLDAAFAREAGIGQPSEEPLRAVSR